MLSKKAPIIQIGVLAGEDARSGEGGDSNVSIGAKHEMGDSETIRRSWLRMPIEEHLNDYLEKSGAFNKNSETSKEAFRTNNFLPLMKKVSIIAETVISDAFDTGGFGEWKPSNMKFKTNHQTLVETQQLRNSVTSRVVEK